MWIFSRNAVGSVLYAEDHDLSEGDRLFCYVRGIEILNPGHQDVDIADEHCCVSDLSESGAFHILDVYLDAQDYVMYTLHDYTLQPLFCTVWHNGDGSASTSSHGGFEVDGELIIYIASRANYLDNWDEWDDSVILHEFGHKIMAKYMERIPDAGGDYLYGFPQFGKDNLAQAMSEGWANLFSAALRNDPVFVNTVVGDDSWLVKDFELPDPDFPYYDHPNDLSNPPDWYPLWEGAHVIGAVVATWWDIFDADNDDDYYIGGTVWGHNNDHNSSSSWRGMQAIWDVMTNFDPQPDNPDHNHCWNWYEFVAGWYWLGYPLDQTFIDLCRAHGVPPHRPGNVDWSDDQAVSMGDITIMVDYLFITIGPSLKHESVGDVDADGFVTMGDLTVMIDALFTSLDQTRMLAGCADMYANPKGGQNHVAASAAR